VQTHWPVLDPGGWELAHGASQDIAVTSCWSGKFVFRTGCVFDSKDKEHCSKTHCCQTGDCNDKSGKSAFSCLIGGEPPATLAEFTFDGGTDANGKKLESLSDTYDVSLVDGWSKSITVQPKGTNFSTDVTNHPYWCTTAGCSSAKFVCPEKLKYKVDKKDTGYCLSPCKYLTKIADGSVSAEEKARHCCVCSVSKDIPCDADHPEKLISCVADKASNLGYGCSPYSAPGDLSPYYGYQCCPFAYSSAKGQPGYNCWGNKLDTTRIWETWAQEYVTNIKAECKTAYAWQFDDEASTYTCESTDGKQLNYTITITDWTQ
jgi:hypothetical protein